MFSWFSPEERITQTVRQYGPNLSRPGSNFALKSFTIWERVGHSYPSGAGEARDVLLFNKRGGHFLWAGAAARGGKSRSSSREKYLFQILIVIIFQFWIYMMNHIFLLKLGTVHLEFHLIVQKIIFSYPIGMMMLFQL